MHFLRVIFFFVLTVMSTAGFACEKAAAADELLSSTFPVFLFTKAVTEGRNNYNVKLMLDSSLGCPHDYAPTPAELERLSRAKILVINGLGLEAFLTKALSVARDDLVVVDASAEGKTGEEKNIIMNKEAAIADLPSGHSHHPDDGHAHDEVNAHLFAAPSSAAAMVENIAKGLAVIDPDGAEIYQANAAGLADELKSLAGRMRELGHKWNRPKVIVSHSIFHYLANDLNLTVVASIEEEDGADPSAARLAQLAGLIRKEGVKAILTDPEGNRKLAHTLGAEAGIPVVVIDPVASGPADAAPGYYQKVMNSNLDVLSEIFS